MNTPNDKMTRRQMQDEALIVQSLLDAAMAMVGDDDKEELVGILEMAQRRARRLNIALDFVNAPEVG